MRLCDVCLCSLSFRSISPCVILWGSSLPLDRYSTIPDITGCRLQIPNSTFQIANYKIQHCTVPHSTFQYYTFQIPNSTSTNFAFQISHSTFQVPNSNIQNSKKCVVSQSRWSLVKDRFTDVEVYSYRPTDYCIFVGRQSVGRTRKTYDVSSPLLEYIMCINTYSVVWRVCVGHTLCILSAFSYQ